MTPTIELTCTVCHRPFNLPYHSDLCPTCEAVAPPRLVRFFTIKTPNGLKIIDAKIKANLEAMNRKARRRWLAVHAKELPKADVAKLETLRHEGAIVKMEE